MASNLAIPYDLSTDHEALYNRIMNGERIAAFIDRTFDDSSYVARDICEFYVRDDSINAGCRGTGIIQIDDFDVQLAKGRISKKEMFLKDCARLNVGWIEP